MAAWTSVMDEVVRTKRPALVGYAYLLTGSRSEAEDIVHDAIVRTFARGRAKKDVRSAEAYIERAIANEVINRAKHRKAVEQKKLTIARPESHPGHADAVAGYADLEQALSVLSARERTVVVLRFVEDLTIPAIGGLIGLQEGTVKRYLSNASQKLRDRLGDDAVEDDTDRARRRVPVMEGV